MGITSATNKEYIYMTMKNNLGLKRGLEAFVRNNAQYA